MLFGSWLRLLRILDGMDDSLPMLPGETVLFHVHQRPGPRDPFASRKHLGVVNPGRRIRAWNTSGIICRSSPVAKRLAGLSDLPHSLGYFRFVWLAYGVSIARADF